MKTIKISLSNNIEIKDVVAINDTPVEQMDEKFIETFMNNTIYEKTSIVKIKSNEGLSAVAKIIDHVDDCNLYSVYYIKSNAILGINICDMPDDVFNRITSNMFG